MKKTICIVMLVFSLSAGAVMAGDPDAVLGTWIVAAKDGHVNIFKCGNKYCGRIVWLKDPFDLDKNNPDPAKRKEKLMGKLMLHGFTYDGSEWEDGKIYDPGNGKTYSCLMWLVGKNKLWVKGYVGISLIGRKELWTRIK
jgi:uncharacterized protein (DUF2147 family)